MISQMTNEEWILAALKENGEQHGSQIQNTVLSLSDGRKRLSIAGLHVALSNLDKQGKIEGRWGDESERDVASGARRRYYKLNP